MRSRSATTPHASQVKIRPDRAGLVRAALAESIRERLVEDTHEGIDAARAAGTRLGRPPAMPPEQMCHARDLPTRPDNSVASIARLLGVPRSTLYKHVARAGGRPGGDSQGP